MGTERHKNKMVGNLETKVIDKMDFCHVVGMMMEKSLVDAEEMQAQLDDAMNPPPGKKTAYFAHYDGNKLVAVSYEHYTEQ